MTLDDAIAHLSAYLTADDARGLRGRVASLHTDRLRWHMVALASIDAAARGCDVTAVRAAHTTAVAD